MKGKGRVVKKGKKREEKGREEMEGKSKEREE